MSDTKKKARIKNASLYEVLLGGKRIAVVRSTSTGEARTALPLTVRRLNVDETVKVVTSGEAVIGMEPTVVDEAQQSLPIPTQDSDHAGAVDREHLPQASNLSEAIDAQVDVHEPGADERNRETRIRR